MKYYILVLSIIVSVMSEAQVGINTNNIQGIFHVDARGNNPQSGVPSATLMTDDVIVDKNSSKGINLSVGGKIATNSSAQLALLETDKAILLNRVALKSLRDIITIPNPPTGTLVYNTATSGVYPDNIIPGYYYFNGIVWYKWQYGQIDSELSQCDLLTNCISTSVSSFAGASSATQSTLADFGTIKIKEKGTYIFLLRLYGVPTANSSGGLLRYSPERSTILYDENVSTKITAIEINSATFGGTAANTHTATLQAVLDKDDVISFRLGHYDTTYGWELIANPVLRANKTSLIYWKI